LLRVLQARFEQHLRRHSGLGWDQVQSRLDQCPGALGPLRAMEATGGEPDVNDRGGTTGQPSLLAAAPPKAARAAGRPQQA